MEGSDNPYRDGYIKEPPKKPRPNYLFFQCCMRSFYQKRIPRATQAEVMTLMGDTWRKMSDKEKEPFQQLAIEESKQFDKERAMMEKAQRPNEVWQPLRRCLMVLDRLVSDSFSEIFLEPVDKEEFPDYEELIDTPMDLRTIRENLKTKKYIAPEQFARDMRKVRVGTRNRWIVQKIPPHQFCAFRSGTTAKFTTSMAQRFGTSQITCRSSLSGCTMRGSWSSGNDTCAGRILVQDRGSILAANVMASVGPQTIRWSFATTATQCTASSA